MINFRECCFRNIPEKGKRLIWEVTHICHFNCEYCFQERKRKQNNLRAVNHSDILAIISKLPALNISDVLITGGEIFHSQDTVQDICDNLKINNIPFSFSTSYINDNDFMNFLVSFSPKSINISFDPLYNNKQSNKSDILSIDKLLLSAQQKNVNIKITGVINKNNIQNIEEYITNILSFISKYKSLATVYLTNPYEIGFIKTGIRSSNEDLDKLVNNKRIQNEPKISFVNFPSFNMPLQKCYAGSKYIHLEPNGNIFPCHLFANNTKEIYCMGNIHFESTARINTNLQIFAKQASGAIDDYKNENIQCTKCNSLGQCGGGCLAEIISTGNRVEPQFVCKLIPPKKKVLENKLSNQLIFNIKASHRDLLTNEESQIVDYVKSNIRKNHQHDLSHGFDHMECVVKLARFISKQENADLRIVSAASYFHDFSPRKNLIFESHTKMSADFAVIFLRKIGFTEEDLQQIHHCIDTSSYGASEQGVVPLSLEAKVVRDADWLEAIGARGIARVFAFGAAHECEVLGEIDWDLNFPPPSRRMSLFGPDPSPIYHFSSKLLKVKDKIVTKTGKQIAEIRHRRLISFLNDYKNEMNEESFLI